jgi:CHASE3 domain sensor protein
MRPTNKIVALLLAPSLLLASPVFAQQVRIVDTAAMSQALTGKAESERAQRDLVRRVLDRASVRDMAAHMGLNIEQANAAVATLSGDDLGRLAQQASAIESDALAGGANTVVISVTTLLLLLIVVILLAK